ncbi:MAG: FapA family protein, partial [bacterium]
GKVISVKPSVLIPGDVSFSTGNVNSPVGVTIQGNVLSGFRVYSKDSVNVGGLVEAAKIISDGDIAINGGVEGKGKGYLEAKGDVRVQFLNDVKVQCDGSVYAAGSIFHSLIWAGVSVIAEGNHGHIAEGGVRAEDEVCAEEIGSEMGVRTTIELGVATLAMPDRIEELKNRETELEEKSKRFSEAAEKMARLKEARGGLDPNKEKNLKKVIAAARKYKELVSAKREEIKELEEAYDAGLRKMRCVKARKQIWPGTVIRILQTEFDVKNPTGPATVALVNEEIQVLPYSEESPKGE